MAGEFSSHRYYTCVEYIAIPYYNDSQNIRDSWLVSPCNDVPTKIAKSLTPFTKGWGQIDKSIVKKRRREDWVKLEEK